jgi:hypothetical protein
MRTPFLSVLLLVLGFGLAFHPASPACAEEEAEAPKPHADEDVEKATERFEQDMKSDEAGTRLRILKWYGLYMHKDVLKRLKKIWLKSSDVELQALAAEGLGNQLPFAKDASRALMQGIEKYEDYATRDDPEGDDELQQALEAKALASALRGLGKLGVKPDKKGWKTIKGLIDHNHDDIAIAMLEWCGATKEWRALPVILSWFEFYPDGYSWSGGSVKVDTGAAGNKDANAAKAKFNSKYGGRAKKSRPAAHAAMKQALLDITGLKFEEPKELKAWMKDNKALLKKNGV